MLWTETEALASPAYEEKAEAVETLKHIRINHSIFGELSYKG